MRITLEPSDLEPPVRRVVQDCIAQFDRERRLVTNEHQEVQPSDQLKLLYTTREAAKLLGVSERSVWDLKRRGELPYVSVGNGTQKDSVRYTMDDLLRFIESRKATDQTR